MITITMSDIKHFLSLISNVCLKNNQKTPSVISNGRERTKCFADYVEMFVRMNDGSVRRVRRVS